MPKTILIIEDDNILQKVMKDALKTEGYSVIQAFDGGAGFKDITRVKPDLIILDLLMPLKPGEWVLKKMNEKGMMDKYPLIVLTVKNDAANTNNLANLNVKNHISKSEYSLEMLTERIKELI
ncbi:response regulator [Candidatus Parcubacteria bacterium]|nr:response regulator [Candidatus Parcubacteria bacterium]